MRQILISELIAQAAHSANSALAPIDRFIFSRRGDTSPAPPIFIVGCPRSGTTLLYQVLTHCLQLGYLPRYLDHAYGVCHLASRLSSLEARQSAPMFRSSYGRIRGLRSPSESFGFWQRWLRKGRLGDHSHRVPLPAMRAQSMADAVSALSREMMAPPLFKCVYLSLAVPALAAAIPDSRFIYMRRDWLDTACSIYKKRTQLPSGMWWSIRPQGYLKRLSQDLADQVVWQVQATGRELEDALHGLDARRYVTVDYTELCAAPGDVAERVGTWAELEPWPDTRLPKSFEPAHAHDARLRRILAGSSFVTSSTHHS